MWQATRNRNRRKHTGLTPSRSLQPVNEFRLQRMHVEVSIQEGIGTAPIVIPARLVLIDFLPEEIGLFSHKSIEIGQLVSIELDYPRKFFISGEVTYCKTFNLNTNVFSKQTFPYRIVIRFTLQSLAERDSAQFFLEELAELNQRGMT